MIPLLVVAMLLGLRRGGPPVGARRGGVAFSSMEIARVAVDASAAPDHSDDRKAVLAGVTVDGAEPSDAEPE